MIAKPNANGSYPEFDAAYWASKSPEVRKLGTFDISDWAGMYHASVLADQLASQGFQIDTPIMVWQWDPGKIMAQRIAYGYTWVPSAKGSNVQGTPGNTNPNVKVPYDPTVVPAGAIKVSLDLDDYPAFK